MSRTAGNARSRDEDGQEGYRIDRMLAGALLLLLLLTAALPLYALHFNYLQFSANVSRTIALLIGIL